MKLNTEQTAIVETVCNALGTNHKVQSYAGSGKTTLLVALVKTLVETHGVKPETIMVTTFTRNASKEMAERLDAQGIRMPLIGTFHSLSLKVTQAQVGIERGIQGLPLAMLQYLMTHDGKTLLDTLRIVIVDEFQDVNHVQYELIRLMSTHCTVIGIGDSFQQIYAFRGSLHRYFEEFVSPFQTHAMTKNYRSSPEILALASVFTPDPLQGVRPSGAKPILMYFSDIKAEIGHVVRQVMHDISQGTRPHDIAIVSRNNSPLFRVEELCLRKKCQTSRHVKKNRVCLTTIHGSKGLEWKHVYVIGCSDDFFPASKGESALEEEQRLFYVAATRARSRLVLTYSGNKLRPSRYIVRCKEHIRWMGVDPEAVFEQGTRDVAENIPEVVPSVRLVGGIPEDRAPVSVETKFPYKIVFQLERFPNPEDITDKELEQEFAHFVSTSLYAMVDEGVYQLAFEVARTFYKKHQTLAALRKKESLFSHVEKTTSSCPVPIDVIPAIERATLRKEKTIADHFLLSNVLFAIHTRNRCALVKTHDISRIKNTWDLWCEFVRDNYKGFRLVKDRVSDSVLCPLALVRGKNEFVFVHGSETLEYEHVLRYLVDAWVCSQPDALGKDEHLTICVYVPLDGAEYKFETLAGNIDSLVMSIKQ